LVSLHADPLTTYPFYSGFADETGFNEGKGNILNIPLPLGTSESSYQEALIAGLEKIKKSGVEVLIVSAGFDTCALDFFSSFGLSTEYYEVVGKTIAGLGLPVLTVQEGGYNIDILGKCVVSYLKGIL